MLRTPLFDDDDCVDDDSSGEDCDDDADDDRLLTVAATVVELGPEGSFAHLAGIAAGEVAVDNPFPLELDPGQGFADMTMLPVQLSGDAELPGTKLLDEAGNPVSVNAIQVGVRELVRGVISVDPNLIRASLVVLNEAIGGTDELSGIIVAVESDGSGLRLLPDDTGVERCVRTSASTGTFLISQDGAGASSSETVTLNGDLEMLNADVYGGETIDGCFDAQPIIAVDEPAAGA